MSAVKSVVWQEGEAWLGYLQDYPDYWTQGENLDDLKEHLSLGISTRICHQPVGWVEQTVLLVGLRSLNSRD